MRSDLNKGEGVLFETAAVARKGPVVQVVLNRPEIHNAFNDVMIAELNEIFAGLAADDSVRVIVFTGSGKSFCAGADLHWMKKMISYTFDENLADSLALADLMYRIYSHPKPVIARVNGSAIGGGTGLVAACDIVVASSAARFSLSEVKIGLVPACIAPYVIKRLGEARARELFLTGERITAERACALGLVNTVVGEAELDAEVDRRVDLLLGSGPRALTTAKILLEKTSCSDLDEARHFTADMIARLRVSDEGQEGMNAFLAKREPSWVLRKGSA